MSDNENPFLIKPKRASNSPKRIHYSGVWNQTEKNDKLIGYLEITPNLWTSIKNGSHIRYITKDGEFRTGGFILKNPFTYNTNDTIIKPNVEIDVSNTIDHNTIGIRLQNYFNKQSADYTTWVVSYNDIMKIYVKVDAVIRTVVQSLEDTIENININMKKITDYIKKLDDRLKKLESKI